MILIAEDILINQKVIQAVLRMNNYEATIVENGAEAVDYFQNTKPELILMDISMPVMNGYDATREIRLIEKKFELHTPIIAVTTHGTTKDKELCIQSGMDSIILKPIVPEDLLRAISDWLVGPMKRHLSDPPTLRA